MDTIRFSTNWNKKLDCDAFTTFRIHNQKYQPGKQYQIECKGRYPFRAECIDKRTLELKAVNEFIAHIDTGYNREDFIKMVRTMYKNRVEVDKVKWDLILLKKIR